MPVYIPLRASLRARAAQRFRRDAQRWRKRAWWQFRPSAHGTATPVFVVGCQRSGTTMLLELLDKATRDTLVYHEANRAAMENHRLRKSSVIDRLLNQSPAPLMVLKPLTDSQRTVQLLRRYPRARSVWLFRHYGDVAASLVGAWPGLHRRWAEDVRRGVAGTQPWQTERISADVRHAVRSAGEDLNDGEAAALFWYARNALYFEQELGSHPRVLLERYEDIVQQPEASMRRILSFVGASSDGDAVGHGVGAPSRHKPLDRLRPAVEERCEAMLAELIAAQQRHPGRAGVVAQAGAAAKVRCA